MMNNFPLALRAVIDVILNLYSFLLIAHALISWVNPDPYNPVVQFLRKMTEPLLNPIRKVLPPIGGLDLSVFVALLAIYLLQQILHGVV